MTTEQAGPSRYRDLYERWPFIRQAVELHVAGVTWQGCNLRGQDPGLAIPPDVQGIVSLPFLQNIVRDMLVEGVGRARMVVEGRRLRLEHIPPQVAEERSLDFTHSGLPSIRPGESFLKKASVAACSLAELVELPYTIDVIEGLESLAEAICECLGLPHWLLSQHSVNQATAISIKTSLVRFRAGVGSIRQATLAGLNKDIVPMIAQVLGLEERIEYAWSNEWLPSSGEDWGPVYQVFRGQGIFLQPLVQEALHTAQELSQRSVPSERAAELTHWYW